MSQPNRPKKGREAPRHNPIPAILSAAIVVAIFVALAFVLARSGPGAATQSGAAPTANPFSVEPTLAGAAEPTPAPEAPTPAPAASDGRKTYSALPPMTIDPKKTYTATITTPRGDIVVKLRPDLAPKTVNSFVFLAKEGFYNGLTWHRVLPNFMAQGGDPTGTGGGGPGYSVPAEFTDKVLFDRPGILAMARANDPNSAGSQFFITTAPAPFLNQKYTIFGEVTQGQEIVNGIPLRDPEQNPTTPGEQIVKITIAEQ
ncbi:MAG TPA: peptidylprolyl isomerase [Roseiflexaceae bacterium]